ncbi:MAG TPA: GAF domain-containing protein [Candidatus Eisenbacteria bacterium]
MNDDMGGLPAPEMANDFGATRPDEGPRLPGESRLSRVASRLSSASIADLDQTIVDGLCQAVELLDLDRSAVWQFTESGDDLVYTHVWDRPGSAAMRHPFSVGTLFPWHRAEIREDRAIWNERVDDVPSAVDRQSLLKLETAANAVVPMRSDGTLIGALSFDSCRRSVHWSPEVRDCMRVLASLFSQTIARARKDRQLGLALDEIARLRNQVVRERIGAGTLSSSPQPESGPSPEPLRLSYVESAHIRHVLERSGWRIRGANGAAEMLGMKPTTLESRMVKLGIHRPPRRIVRAPGY